MIRVAAFGLSLLLSCAACDRAQSGSPPEAPKGAPVAGKLPVAPQVEPKKANTPKPKPSQEEIDALHTGFDPRFKIDAREDDAVSRFVDSHQGEDIPSLGLRAIAPDSKGFAHLKRLKGLTSLTLSGSWSHAVVREVDGRFFFGTALTDEAVGQIAEIGTLKYIWIWYGSFSDSQKATILQRNPGCRFEENLNKL